ncbi:MAG: glycosyltransferase [Rubrobacteridae bacterium]|nr:glycosyltransferase [Rubrobacteridae bacterium]
MKTGKKQDATKNNVPKKRHSTKLTAKPVIGVWAGDLNNFQFIEPIIDRLKESFCIHKYSFDRNDLKALKENLAECDLAWFDWANDAVVPASFNKTIDIPYVCRLHRYEVYGHFPTTINWARINKLVFVSDSVRESFRSYYPDYFNTVESMVIKNGVDLNKFRGDLSRPRKKNIAYLGRLHYVKNPSLLLQCFAAIVKKDPEFKFHVAGEFSESVIKDYFWDQVKKLGLENSLTYYGKIDNADTWLQNMDYMILPSIIEGEPVSILEAMATGIKPIVANYINAENFLPEEYLFNTVDECVNLIMNGSFDRTQYRSYVEINNNFEDQVLSIKALIEELLLEAGHSKNLSGTVSEDEWDILIPESRFMSQNDKDEFRNKLLTSSAEILKVKVAYPIVEDHLIGRWEIAAIRKTIKTNRFEELNCSAICLEEIHLPYNDALEAFIGKQYQQALGKFVEHYKNSMNTMEKIVYSRWLALCLIELDRNREAIDILSDSIQLNSDNSDLYYLYLKASMLDGNMDGIAQVIETIYELGEAVSYPEFICDVQQKADELAGLLTANQVSA